MSVFDLQTPFDPAGGQPQAIKELVENYEDGDEKQTLLGITGSGKSVDYEETLLVANDDGTVEKLPIGEYVDTHLHSPQRVGDTEYQNIRGGRVVSFDPATHEMSLKRVTQVSRPSRAENTLRW